MNSSFVAQALDLSFNTGSPSVEFASVVTDSRKVPPGSLFVALKGEKFDGHDFIGKALEQKAGGILCRRGSYTGPRPDGTLFFEVDDTLEAYRRLGAAWRRRFSIPIVMVAGSAGKTTTKEILSALLRGRYRNVLKTQGSQNGYIGIPMTLLELRPDHEAAVIEVGIDEIGAMEKHVRLVEADSAVLTAIGPEHLEHLQDVPTVAREERIALTYVAGTGGKVAINLDDPWIRPAWEELQGAKATAYSLSTEGPLLPEAFRGALSADGKTLLVRGPGISGESFTLPLPGRHNAANLLAAITVAAGLGLTPAQMREGLSTFQGAEGRSQVREFPRSITVLCDYYNSQPASVAAGLELLTQIAGTKKGQRAQRWACLGDMLELGAREETFHRELADLLMPLVIEQVLLYGPRMKWLEDELRKRRYPGQVRHFPTHAELAQTLKDHVSPGDSILIKGSRSMKMEEVWKPFSEHLNQ